MQIIPAIDIINGKPVRLYQGDYSKMEQVGESILDIAKRFEKEGTEYLHLVDLDAAKCGVPCNEEIIIKVAQSIDIPVEVGGGIRNMEQIKHYLNNGVNRVILGTAAIEDEELLREAVREYGDSVAVGIDCKDGYAYGRGWLASSDKEYITFAQKLQSMGVRTIIFTDISKDGTLQGPNLAMLKKLRESVDMYIIASGGIRDIENIEELRKMGVDAAITGKAMYAGTLNLADAIKIGREV
ncbi:1-(5-phosphoribosyl)-5-[(5-phosphoribosylamino)methylideneamino] imidazole-4-carboxamide isomerase [Hathewaya proteolytica DSM 3090]|uniref:1-(5-phosphoribosyl)-5-[(5-phosphoribosylamino)methylideneamino] imidazole-4-carboxamide isomerase n=1 Tax=Hathewaya proteolytica DSM 3090 TaxID=1121331 RepID=A0A1M6RGY2_9CLOT|nr:1-(5-phosphoribosyl)-5-[(5-phosphoribosylamino)methylideneamino]imidazole-4-carboxamide isomerase [Hathewaya proteolytica]SHK31617.1 1-(5-phosphoribosyl)-5-[(5-phosphoribosylamino)methylideneamino] imidazole-4-carboxamide isomerase [Hathewaya proteolytica DSM 3090]